MHGAEGADAAGWVDSGDRCLNGGGVGGRFEDGDFADDDDLLADPGVPRTDETGLMTGLHAVDCPGGDACFNGGGPGRKAALASSASCLMLGRAPEEALPELRVSDTAFLP